MFQPTLEDILRSGERFYLESLKEKLEKNNLGEYVVIDTDTNNYIINSSKLNAIDEAKATFGNKLFYTVQIGSLDTPTVNHRERLDYAWNF